jgi:hypothetical protein
MHQLNMTELALVTGGASGGASSGANGADTFAPRNPMFINVETVMKTAGYNPTFAAVGTSNLYNHTAQSCMCSQATILKNGDRNAKGQIYSWGTWWDDMN